MQIIYIIYNLLGGEWIVAPKIKEIKKSRKRSVYGTFGTLRGTRTLDLLVRSPNDKSQLYGFKPLLASFCLYVTPNYSIISMYS